MLIRVFDHFVKIVSIVRRDRVRQNRAEVFKLRLLKVLKESSGLRLDRSEKSCVAVHQLRRLTAKFDILAIKKAYSVVA